MSSQTLETLSQRLIDLISTNHDIPKEDISLDSQFVADLGFDSLDQIEFVMNVEDEFDIEVSDEIAETIKTVRDAVQAIQESIS